MQKIKTANKKKYMLIAAVIVILAGAAAAFFVYRDRQESTEEEPASVVADPNFTGGTDRDPGGSVDHQGGGVVQDDDTPEKEPQGEPTISPEGTISIYEPQQNQVLKPGDRLYGKTSFDTVWYRLIDDKVGVIAEGSMEAKNGAFSGSFDFTTTGSEGRLDVFYRDEDGLESDNVEINVKFK